MARFRGTIQGTRGPVSRLGDKKNGFEAHVNGWDKGIQVIAFVDPETEEDVFKIYKTGGSKAKEGAELIATL